MLNLNPTATENTKAMSLPTEKQISGITASEDCLVEVSQREKEKDHRFIKETNESMDTMMIFAGLFSAAITQFISSTSIGLKADSNDLTNQLLAASIMLQRDPNSPMPNFSNPEAFTPSNLIITINAMLFFSLILSLLSALGAMIVKQWIRRYETYGAEETLLWKQARDRTEIHGILKDCRLEKVIAYIPYTLHLALGIFLSAVLVWIYTLNSRAMIPSAVLVGTAAVLYFSVGIASLLPGVTAPHQDARDVEEGDVPIGQPPRPFLHPTPVTFILNPPADLKPRVEQERPQIAIETDATFWIDVIKGTEKHDDLLKAFYEIRTANWGVRLDAILIKNGDVILRRCADVATFLWEPFEDTICLKRGAEEPARAICLFVEWLYHQLSKPQRQSLKNWPDSRVARALMQSSFQGGQVSSQSRVSLPNLEDIALASSVIAKLHHVRLVHGTVCGMCVSTSHRGDADVRVLLARATDPTQYINTASKRDRYPFEQRMQSLVSACVSSDADCLLHYLDGLDEGELRTRLTASHELLAGCVLAYSATLLHHRSYVELRQMLESLRRPLRRPEPRLEWFEKMYDYAVATS